MKIYKNVHKIIKMWNVQSVKLIKYQTNKYKINKLMKNQHNEKQFCFTMLIRHVVDT